MTAVSLLHSLPHLLLLPPLPLPAAQAIATILAHAAGEKYKVGEEERTGKKRKFLETIELQIGLKNYDPTKDKRFNGTFRLPLPPRPRLKLCVLGHEAHVTEAKALGLDAMTVEDLKKLNKNKKLVKKLAAKYDGFLASHTLIKQIPRLLGPGLNRAGKFPTLIGASESLEAKVEEIDSQQDGLMHRLAKDLYLRTIDELWKNHLQVMDQLRTGIGRRRSGSAPSRRPSPCVTCSRSSSRTRPSRRSRSSGTPTTCPTTRRSSTAIGRWRIASPPPGSIRS